jgi:chromosome segregation ATPase
MTIRANSSILGGPETHRSEEDSALKATLANSTWSCPVPPLSLIAHLAHFMSMLAEATKNVQLESAEAWTALIRDTQKTAAEDLAAQKMDHESKLKDVKKEYESKMRELLWDNKSKAIKLDVLRKLAEPICEAKAMSLLASNKADMDVSDKKLEIDALKDNINALKDTIAALKDTVAALKDNINASKDIHIVPEDATGDLRETNEDLRKRNDELSAAYGDKKEQLRKLDNKHRELLELHKTTEDKQTAAMDDLSASYGTKDAKLERLKKNYKQPQYGDRVEMMSLRQLGSNVDQRDERIGQLKVRVKQRDATIDELNAKAKQLGGDLAMSQQQVQQRDSHVEELEEQLAQAKTCQGVFADRDEVMAKHKRQLQERDIKIRQLQQRVNQSADANQCLLQEVSQNLNKIIDLQRELGKSRGSNWS